LLVERRPRTGISARPDRSRDPRNEITSGGVRVRSSNRSIWYWPPCRRVASARFSEYRNISSDPLGNLSSGADPFHTAPSGAA
jgi:hypothetical protein